MMTNFGPKFISLFPIFPGILSAGLGFLGLLEPNGFIDGC